MMTSERKRNVTRFIKALTTAIVVNFVLGVVWWTTTRFQSPPIQPLEADNTKVAIRPLSIADSALRSYESKRETENHRASGGSTIRKYEDKVQKLLGSDDQWQRWHESAELAIRQCERDSRRREIEPLLLILNHADEQLLREQILSPWSGEETGRRLRLIAETRQRFLAQLDLLSQELRNSGKTDSNVVSGE